MINLISVDKVIKTELDITATIEPEPLGCYDQEIVVIDGLGLLVEFGPINRVDVPLVMQGLLGKGG